jgi:hypothetical protein
MADAVTTTAQVRIGLCDVAHDDGTVEYVVLGRGRVLQPPARQVAASWLRSSGRDPSVQLSGLDTQSEPPQVNSGPLLAQIQWHSAKASPSE